MIKATLSGPADEPSRSTYNIGGKPGGRVSDPETDGVTSSSTGRAWSSIAGIDTSSGPWYESYGNGGGHATMAAQAEARRQTVAAQDEWNARRAQRQPGNTSPWPAPEFDASRIPLGRTASKLGKILRDR